MKISNTNVFALTLDFLKRGTRAVSEKATDLAENNVISSTQDIVREKIESFIFKFMTPEQLEGTTLESLIGRFSSFVEIVKDKVTVLITSLNYKHLIIAALVIVTIMLIARRLKYRKKVKEQDIKSEWRRKEV